VTDDGRAAHSGGPVPQEMGIHGTHGITVSVYDLDLSADFMTEGWSGRHTQEEGDHARFEVGAGGSGAIVDFVAEPGLGQAGWMYGEGIVHHTAFQVANLDVQNSVKDGLVGLGFTDVSDRKDRGYFDSVYVRTPGGAMFEATVSKPTGFTIDEPMEELGQHFQVPPVFEDRREFLLSYLEPLQYS
jgi:glyoxalase family protein